MDAPEIDEIMLVYDKIGDSFETKLKYMIVESCLKNGNPVPAEINFSSPHDIAHALDKLRSVSPDDYEAFMKFASELVTEAAAEPPAATGRISKMLAALENRLRIGRNETLMTLF